MQTKYSTIRELARYYPSFTESSLRYLIFNKDTNGLTPCLRKVGKKILIDLEKFAEWIDKQKC